MNGDNAEVASPRRSTTSTSAPKQIVGVSAALIPFLEHDDANRALMGSNMQRQAVPLLMPEPPCRAPAWRRSVAQNSAWSIIAESAGVVTYVDSHVILVDNDEYLLTKFRGLNERTCLNQKPVVKKGQRSRRARSSPTAPPRSTASSRSAERARRLHDLRRLQLRGRDRHHRALVKDDTFTSIHIEEYEVEIRETKLGREEFTRDIPNVGEKALANLDETGIVRIGTLVEAGDILVGKVAPKSKSELTPEEKLCTRSSATPAWT